MRRFFAAVVVVALAATACRGIRKNRDQPGTPVPLTLTEAPPLTATACTASAVPALASVPVVTSGVLSVIEVRGDPRLALERFSFQWSSDGQHLVATTQGGAVERWSAATGERVWSFQVPAQLTLLAPPASSPDDAWIAVAAENGAGEYDGWLVSTAGVRPPRAFGPVRDVFASGNGSVVPALRFSPDGKRLLTRTQVWDVTGDAVRLVPKSAADPVDGRTSSALVAPDGLRVLRFRWVDRTSTPELVERATGKVLAAFPPVPFREATAFSADGKRLVLLGVNGLRVFDTATFAETVVIPEARGMALQLTPNGRFALTDSLPCVEPLLLKARTDAGASVDPRCEEQGTQLWDLTTRTLVYADGMGGMRRRLSDDGALLIGAALNGVRSVLRVRDRQTLQFGIHTLSVAPDGKRLAYEASDGIHLAALADGVAVPALQRPPRILARSADGSRFAAIAADGNVRVEGPEGCFAVGLRAEWGPEFLHRYAFSPDGSTFVTTWWDMQNGFTAYGFSVVDGTVRWSRTAPNGVVALLDREVVAQAWGHPELRRFSVTNGEEVLPPWRAPMVASMDRGAQVNAFTRRDPEGPYFQMVHEGLTASADGGMLAAMGMLEEDAHLSVWPAFSPEAVRDVRIGGGLWHDPFVVRTKAAPDGETWAVSTTDGTLVVVDRSGSTTVLKHGALVRDFAFTGDGDRIVTATEKQLQVVEVKTGAVVGEAWFPGDPPRTVWVAADGTEVRVESTAPHWVRLRVKARSASACSPSMVGLNFGADPHRAPVP